MDPNRVGEIVLEGIRENRPYVFTHRGIERRMQAVLSAFEGVDD